MMRVSVMYPSREGKTFDYDDYVITPQMQISEIIHS